MKKIAALLLTGSLILILSCTPFWKSYNGDYPDLFKNCTWNEISKDEAVNLWKQYPAGKMHSSADVYVDYPGDIYKYKDCSISYDEARKNYKLNIYSSVYYLTRTEDEINDYANDDTKFYKCDSDENLIKIVNGTGWWNVAVYEKGWLREGRVESEWNNDHEYFCVKYK